jgi:hypothetical protein
MPSNTVQSVVARFLSNKHRDEFMALNPWMDLPTAAIVYFRRHTSHKLSYGSHDDQFVPGESYDKYVKEYQDNSLLHWYQIPVSQKQCAGIRPATLEKYYNVIQEIVALQDQLQDVQ